LERKVLLYGNYQRGKSKLTRNKHVGFGVTNFRIPQAVLSFFGSYLRVDADQGGGVVYFVYSLLL
jgi:hypothetical protein